MNLEASGMTGTGPHPGVQGERGFTLVELLVVMSIIAVLAGLSVVGMRSVFERSHVGSVEHDISLFRTAIESFNQEMRDYPPTDLSSLGIVGGNRTNLGCEALFACLQTRKKNGPFLADLDDSRWSNTDDDALSDAALEKVKKVLDWVRDGKFLLEYTDYWGNPFIYIHNADYGRKFTYVLAEGTTVEVEAAKSEATGGYAAPTSFQLWSVGPNGENENGGGDDIVSWRS